MFGVPEGLRSRRQESTVVMNCQIKNEKCHEYDDDLRKNRPSTDTRLTCSDSLSGANILQWRFDELISVRELELIVCEEISILGNIERIVRKGQDHWELIREFVTQGQSVSTKGIGVDEKVLSKDLADPFVRFLVVVAWLRLVLVVSF